MKKFFSIIILLSFCVPVLAQIPTQRIKNPPVGTFRKTRSGKIVQYDHNGKKIGVYKLENNHYKKIK